MSTIKKTMYRGNETEGIEICKCLCGWSWRHRGEHGSGRWSSDYHTKKEAVAAAEEYLRAHAEADYAWAKALKED